MCGSESYIGVDHASGESIQMDVLIFVGRCPRCGTVNDARGEMSRDGLTLEMPTAIKCFSCGLMANTLVVDEQIDDDGNWSFDSAELWFVDFCQCVCHYQKGARCGFHACCRHSGEVYAEKWPALPVKESSDV